MNILCIFASDYDGLGGAADCLNGLGRMQQVYGASAIRPRLLVITQQENRRDNVTNTNCAVEGNLE